MANKMTKREYFAILTDMVEVSEVANKADVLGFIAHEVELLDRKSAKSGQTKTQKENVAVKENIKAALAEFGKAVTVSEIMTKVDLSNQKISALLRQMVKAGEVVRTEEKKKAYFALAE